MERREILFVNLIVTDGKKQKVIEKCVILKGDTIYKKHKIIKSEFIRSLGFENKATGFTEGIKSDEKRNDVTGAYD
jgi:hypothetical protein